MIKCVIIDNDDFAILAIQNLIESLSEYKIEVVKTFTSSVDAINEVNDLDFNLLFIDYEMPGYNGVEFVQKMSANVSVIFVSSHADKSIDIVNNVNIVGFLEKPPLKHKLEKILKTKDLLLRTQIKINKIIIPNGKGEYYLKKDDIYFIKSLGKYKQFFGANSELAKETIEISFTELEKRLGNHGFKKVSKSYMVNACKIDKSSKSKILLENGTEIELGESEKKNFITKIKLLFKS